VVWMPLSETEEIAWRRFSAQQQDQWCEIPS
jgi:hypothetical protein